MSALPEYRDPKDWELLSGDGVLGDGVRRGTHWEQGGTRKGRKARGSRENALATATPRVSSVGRVALLILAEIDFPGKGVGQNRASEQE